MKQLLLQFLFLLISVPTLSSQDIVNAVSLPPEQPGYNRVYAELLGQATNFLGLNKNVVVSVDLGQFQSAYKSYTILDDDGNTIKFNSMVAAMNYMGQRGWKFIQAYVVSHGKNLVYHWLLYKDVTDQAQIYDKLHVKNTDSEPETPDKEKKKTKKNKSFDDIYSN